MPVSRWSRVGSLVVLSLASSASMLPVSAAEEFEIAMLGGITRFEQALTGDRASLEPTVGLRVGYIVTSHLAWYVDALYASTDVRSFREGAAVLTGRTGLEYLLRDGLDARWFVAAGAGYTWIDFDQGADYDNLIYSAGLGQRIRVGRRMQVRWEVRADVAVSRGGYPKTLNDSKILVGLVW